MKAWALVMIGVLLASGAVGAAAEPLKLTAYVNIASGCQKPTEEVLAGLARKFGKRLAVEIVDFGEPAGKKRWQADGLHCMAILLNGSEKADIVYKGAPLQVAFLMPPGHAWLLEELETAVRQKLDGVAAADRQGPALSVAMDGVVPRVLAAGEAVFDAADAAEAERVRAALGAAAAAKALVQDDFALDIVGGAAKVTLRRSALLDLGPVEGPVPADAGEQAEARFVRLISQFPRIARPFPGQPGPQMGR
jgi:hypothetical protein